MKSNTFNILIQLYIEQILSGAKSYLASHPELGVPLGVFNYKHEPNYEARVKSIKKLGLKGNKFSLHLAEILRIKTPIPSFFDPEDPIDGPGPPPEDCSYLGPGYVFFPGVGCVFVGFPDDDDDEEVFALTRISSAYNINFGPTNLNAEVNSIFDIGSTLPVHVGSNVSTVIGGGVYDFINGVVLNAAVNNEVYADEFNIGSFSFSDQDYNGIVAAGNISFSDWLDDNLSDQRNTVVQGNALIETIEAGVGAPYQPPHHMGYFVNNACLDPSLQNPPDDDDDNTGGFQDEVGFDFG